MVGITKVVERTHTTAMEQLQGGYVSAVAASAGALAEFVNRDYHGYDVELIRQPDPLVEQAAVRLQLKSTTQIKPDPTAGHIKFKFKERKHFEQLAMPRTTLKHLLVVMVVGLDQCAWTDVTHDRLSVLHCCYWVNLSGRTTPLGVASPTVSIPTVNVFDASA